MIKENNAQPVSLFLSFFLSQFLAYRVFPPPAGAVYCVCGLRAENHMLFVLFVVAAVFHVTVTTCWKRTQAPRDNKLFTIIYRLFFCRLNAKKYQQSMQQSNKSKWQHNFSLENAYKNKKPVFIHNTGCSLSLARSLHAALSLAALAWTHKLRAALSLCYASNSRSLSLSFAHNRATGASADFCFYFEFTLRCMSVCVCASVRVVVL